ncbi:hypothetical protein TrLO_g13112 [Triparma laevis f. longispina]|uniref:Uncharacterized protein n=1 Tax=Triparma laevis f. longispina TaxID=1714387 RepID=A0A9W7KZD8_9STRA|nr:hypothetical protein TrLO_g13112 [Triparma laevis f. longispina]
MPLSAAQLGKLSRKSLSMMQKTRFEAAPSSPKNKKKKRPPQKNLSRKLPSINPRRSQQPLIDSGIHPRIDMHGRERKSTPSSDPLSYSSSTLPRPKTKQQTKKGKAEKDAGLRWVVDSREQLEYVASRRNELESRGTIARRMYDRKMANNTTSINFDGFGENKIEYVSDMMRSFVSRDKFEGYERRDPFQDLKRAKQLKQMLQKSNIDLGSGFGGNDSAWITDNQASSKKVRDAVKVEEEKFGKRDPFVDIKRARALKQQLQKSTVDLGSGFGGNPEAWITDKQFCQMVVDKALSSGEFKGRDPSKDRAVAKALKKHLQRTTLQLGFDNRYM